MPKFSDTSSRKLATCDERLAAVFAKVIETLDCTILVGHRPKEEQDEALRAGKSKVAWPNSKHNSYPSKAVDVAPYPIVWGDREAFVFFAGYVLATAQAMGIKLRWGGDWNGDGRTSDDLRRGDLSDLDHFELAE